MEDSISSLELSFKRLTSELHLVSHHVKAECRSSKDKASIVDLLSRLQALESRLPKVKAKAEHLLEKRSEIVTETAAVLLDNRNKMLALSQNINFNVNGNNSHSNSNSNEHDYENTDDGNEAAQVNDLVEVLKSNALSVDQSNATLVSVFRKCDEISSINCNSNSIIASSAKSTLSAAANSMSSAAIVEGGGGSQNTTVAHASSMNVLQSPRAGARLNHNQTQQHPTADHSSELMILAQAKVGFMDHMLTEDKFAKLAPNIKGVAKLSDVVKLYKRLQVRTTNQLVSVLKASGEENISSSNSNSNSELVAPMLPYLEIAKLENLKMNDKLLENSVNCLKHLGMATLYQRNKLQLTLIPIKESKVGGNRPMNLSASLSSSTFGTSSGVVGNISTTSTNASSRSSPGGSRNSSFSLSSSLSSSSSTASQAQAHMHSHLNNPPVTLGNTYKIAAGLSNAPRRVHK